MTQLKLLLLLLLLFECQYQKGLTIIIIIIIEDPRNPIELISMMNRKTDKFSYRIYVCVCV